MHRLLPLVEPPRQSEPRRVALDCQDLVRHGHRVVHHEPPREGRDVARLVLALDRRVGVERCPQLLEPLEPLRERRVEEERLERQRARERDSRGGAELNERLTKRPRSNQYGLVEGAPDEARGDNEGSNNEQSAASANSNGDMLPVDEVKARLRALGQPITYFAESDKERYDRLQQVETDSVVDDEFTIGGGHGTRNIFLEQDSRRANDDYEEEDDDDGR